MLPRAAILFATLMCGAGFVAHANRPEPAPPRTNFEGFPFRIEAWTGQPLPPMDPKVLAVLGVDDLVNRAYYRPDHAAAGLYIGYYKSQRQGDAIHSPLNCLPGAGWEPMSRVYLTIPIAAGAAGSPTAISVNRDIIQKGLDRQLVLYWYQSHGHVIASEYWSKFFLIRDAMRLNRTDAALVRVIVPMTPNIDDSETQAERQGVDFVKAMFPILPRFLPS
jgi:EpsI family protein